MNAQRRKNLRGIIEDLESIQAYIEEAKEALCCIVEEKQAAFENLPEGIQNSERGQQMQEYIDTMETASSDLDDLGFDSNIIIETLDEIAH